MPVIPTLDQPSVQRRALGARQQQGISPTAFTGQAENLQRAATGIAEGSKVLQAIEDRKQEERDTARVMAASAAFEKEVVDRIISVKELKGMNAWGEDEASDKWFNEVSQKYVNSAENSRQRAAMQKLTLQKSPSFRATVKGHVSAESMRGANDAAAARQAASINAAAADPGNTIALEESVAQIKNTAAVQQAMNGWDDGRREQEILGHTTTMHRQIIKQKLNQDPALAKAHYEVYKDQIAGVDHAEIEGWLETGHNLVQAQEFVDQMMAKGASEEEQLSAARKRFEGEEEQEAVAEITRRFSQEQSAVSRNQQAAFRAADQILFEGGTYADIPKSLLGQLSRADRERLRDEQYGKVTDWPTYYSLRQISARDPEMFRDMDLTPYFGKLDDAKRAEMIKLQTKAATAPDELALGRTKWQVMQQAAVDAGFDPSKVTDDGSAGEEVRDFYRRIDDEVVSFYQQHGKEPSQTDMLKITDDLARQVVYERPWIIPDTERAAAVAEVEGVPQHLVPGLARRVEGAGKDVTDENVQKLYNYLISKGLL